MIAVQCRTDTRHNILVSPVFIMSLPLESPYPFSLTDIADRTLNGLIEAALRAGWSPITRLAEAITISYVFITIYCALLMDSHVAF